MALDYLMYDKRLTETNPENAFGSSVMDIYNKRKYDTTANWSKRVSASTVNLELGFTSHTKILELK